MRRHDRPTKFGVARVEMYSICLCLLLAVTAALVQVALWVRASDHAIVGPALRVLFGYLEAIGIGLLVLAVPACALTAAVLIARPGRNR